MVKFVAILSLRPGVDPEEAFRYWREKHTEWAKEKILPEVLQYTAERVVSTIPSGPPYDEKNTCDDVFGIVEFLFPDMESATRAMDRLRSAKPDLFLTKYIKPTTRLFVQQDIIYRSPEYAT